MTRPVIDYANGCVDREVFMTHRGFAIVPMGFCFPGTEKGRRSAAQARMPCDVA